ncbi:hypothetical protein C8Q80DRAFT_913046 [Daedaleopsis nitida]|nr:hypothetical protein C8Q80DRAFT_913046 [Daedaleopsis nitida]
MASWTAELTAMALLSFVNTVTHLPHRAGLCASQSTEEPREEIRSMGPVPQPSSFHCPQCPRPPSLDVSTTTCATHICNLRSSIGANTSYTVLSARTL